MLQTATYQNDIQIWASWFPKRGEIYYCDLDGIDCEQQGIRPVVIVSNDIGNQMGSIVVICPITTKKKFISKIHVPLGIESGLRLNSFILTEHVRSISKRRFFYNDSGPIKVGSLNNVKIKEMQNAIKFELGFIA